MTIETILKDPQIQSHVCYVISPYAWSPPQTRMQECFDHNDLIFVEETFVDITERMNRPYIADNHSSNGRRQWRDRLSSEVRTFVEANALRLNTMTSMVAGLYALQYAYRGANGERVEQEMQVFVAMTDITDTWYDALSLDKQIGYIQACQKQVSTILACMAEA
ncbi:MAG: hypothetical protein AABW64_04010 [Nanoarchaeota archaeon]